MPTSRGLSKVVDCGLFAGFARCRTRAVRRAAASPCANPACRAKATRRGGARYDPDVAPTIVLLDSGSLDSLAARVVLDRAARRADIAAVHIRTGFVRADKESAVSRRSVTVIDAAVAFAREVALPQALRYATPRCVECRAFALRSAEPGGSTWLATGEVLGQHPESQSRAALHEVARAARVEGRIVRPLSARRLPESAPERAGALDRHLLEAIHGRGRAGQRTLAAACGATEFPQPGGKCCELRDPSVYRRLRDLAAHDDPPADVALTRTGRHFRVSHDARVVVARDRIEEQRLEVLADPRYHRLRVAEGGGAMCVLAARGPSDLAFSRAAALAARFGRGVGERDVGIWRAGEARVLRAAPPAPEELDSWRV